MKRSDEMRFLEVNGVFTLPDVSQFSDLSYFDASFKYVFGSVFSDIYVEKKLSHHDGVQRFYVYGKPVFFNTVLSDTRFCIYVSRSLIRVCDLIESLIPYEEEPEDSAAEEEITDEAETDVEEVQSDLSELRGSVPFTGDDGNDHVVGDPVSADPGSADPLINESLDDLGKDPDRLDCAHCPVVDWAAFTLSVLIGGAKHA